MSETTSPEVLSTSIKRKIIPKDVHNPDLVKAQPETFTGILWGGLVGGIASSVEEVPVLGPDMAPTGKMHYALNGEFMAIKGDTGEVVQATTLYMPPGVHDHVVAQVLAANPTGKERNLVRFAYQLGSKRAKNPIGYEWHAKPIGSLAKGITPLGDFGRELLGIAGVPVPPLQELPQLEAPAAEEVKSKK